MPLTRSEYRGLERKLNTLITATTKAISDNETLLAAIEDTATFDTDQDLQDLHSEEMADKTLAYGDLQLHFTETVKPFLMDLKPIVVPAKAKAPTPTPTITPTITPITPTPTITPPGPTPCARPCVVRAKPSIVRGH